MRTKRSKMESEMDKCGSDRIKKNVTERTRADLIGVISSEERRKKGSRNQAAEELSNFARMLFFRKASRLEYSPI